MTDHQPVYFRPAVREDAPVILSLIRALADYEKLAHRVAADAALIERNLFGDRPYAECILAEIGGEIAGFALFFHNFSTFLGRPGLYIEDVYVHPQFRARGIGRRFFAELARIAAERDCGRMEWACLDWNEPALRFYRTLGAETMDEWITHRLQGNSINALAAGGDSVEQAA